MSQWMDMVLIFTLIGFETNSLGIMSEFGALRGANGAIEGLLLTGFILFVLASVMVLLIKFVNLEDNLPAKISVGVMELVIVIVIATGAGLYGGQVNNNPRVYPMTLISTGGGMALCGTIFTVVEILIGQKSSSAVDPKSDVEMISKSPIPENKENKENVK